MKLINKKIIINSIKKFTIILISLSFIFSNVPFGFFEFYFNKLEERNIVDLMWIAEHSRSVIDSFEINKADAAEVTIESDTTDTTEEFGPSPTVVFTTDQTGYLFFVDLGNDLVYRKTTNGGTNWAVPVIIDNALTGWTNVSVWYDGWTPGDTTGTKIHIAASDDVTGDVYYTYLDTTGDSLKGSVVSAIPQTTFTGLTNAAPSITKGGGGDLFITANFATTAGGYVYKSSDGAGNTWTNITPSGWSSVAIDQIQLLPLKTNNDIIAIKAETASNAMKYQVYDEVANSWAGTWTTIGTMVENTTYDQWFSATLKKSTGDIYLTFANYTNNAANDIEFWSLPDSTRTFSKKTDVRTNSNLLSPVPLVDENTGDIYVAYLEGQTNFVYSGMGIGSITYLYYHKSTDGGETWSERMGELNNNIGDDYRYLRSNLLSNDRLFVAYYDDDDNDIWGTTISLVSKNNLTKDLVSVWNFDETSGATVYDSYGSNNGSNNGAALNGAGKIGNAYDFEASESDYIQIPNTDFNFDYNQPFSISAWVKRESSTGGVILSKMDTSLPWQNYTGWGLWLESDGDVTFSVRNTTNDIYGRTTESVPLDVWTHIAATYDGSGTLDGVSVYLNEVKSVSWSASQDDFSGSMLNSANTTMGSWGDGSFNFDGLIDQVSFWKKSLNSSEVSLLYNVGSGLDNDEWSSSSLGILVEANIDTAIIDATDEYGPSPSGVFLDEETGYQFYVRTNTILDATDEFGPSPTVVFTDANTGYIFFVDSPSQDLVYRKTIDGGITWSGSVIIDTNIAGWTAVSVWYDGWTPGADTTQTKIHVAASDDISDDVYYTYLDTNGDVLKGNVVMAVSGTTTITEAADGPPTITKGGGGDLFIAANFTNTAGGKVSKSSDGTGNTWTNITPSGWSSVAIDQIQLLPLKTNNDIIAIKAETASNAMKYQVYDEVANSWAGTWTTIGTMVENTTYDQWFSATLKKSTGDIYLTFANYTNNAANDIEFWSLPDSTRTFSKSATNVISDDSSALAPVPFYEEDTGTIYVAYTRGSIAATMHVYFKSSTDGGATWSGESTALSTTGDDFKSLRGNMMSSDNLFIVWYNDDTNVIRGDNILSPVSYDLPVSGVQSVVYRKTVDGGSSWGPPYTIANMFGATSVAVWYDGWTPGDTTGTKIHVAFSDDQTDNYYYVGLDTSNDTITTHPVPVILGTTITEAGVGVPGITKGGSGDLFLSGNFNTTAGGKVSKSSDGGLTWTDVTPSGWSTVAIDQIQLLPLKNNNDIIAIKAETASNAMKYQIYDEATDSWSGTWTTIATMVENVTYDQWFSATLSKTSGNIYLTFANYTNNAANDIELWSFSDNLRSWKKQGEDVYSNTANAIMPVVLLDETNGYVYVVYLRGALESAMNVYYKKSVNVGVTWGVESAPLNPGITDDVKALRSNLLSDKRLYVFWYNDDLNDIYGNTVAQISPPSLPLLVGQSSFRFLENLNSLQPGLTLAPMNSDATLPNSYKTDFRLRLILSFFNQDVPANNQNFKLQYSLESGYCDSDFSGEVYEDITNDTEIAYYDNPSVDNSSAFWAAAISDPTDNSLGSIVSQTYVENNNFSNSNNSISNGHGGKWDFSLHYKGISSSEQSYCIRAVKENGDLLDSYQSVLPKITTAPYRSRGGNSAQHLEEVETPDGEVGGGNVDGGEEVILPICSDGIDNDLDSLIDANDPDCHMDGNILNPYVPEHNSESIAPVSNTGGGIGDTGGDLGYLLKKSINFFRSLKYFGNYLLAMAFRNF